jgi:hypothetical protein
LFVRLTFFLNKKKAEFLTKPDFYAPSEQIFGFFLESCLDGVEVGVGHEVVGMGKPKLPEHVERVERAGDVPALFSQFTLKKVMIRMSKNA